MMIGVIFIVCFKMLPANALKFFTLITAISRRKVIGFLLPRLRIILRSKVFLWWLRHHPCTHFAVPTCLIIRPSMVILLNIEFTRSKIEVVVFLGNWTGYFFINMGLIRIFTLIRVGKVNRFTIDNICNYTSCARSWTLKLISRKGFPWSFRASSYCWHLWHVQLLHFIIKLSLAFLNLLAQFNLTFINFLEFYFSSAISLNPFFTFTRLIL